MKKTTNRTKRMMVAILAAAVIAAAPAANIVPVLLTASAADVKLENELDDVTTKGQLIVEFPDGVSDSYEVKAYKMLKLMIPKGSDQPTQMKNEDNSNNIYVVTDKFKDFFSNAKDQYTDTTNKLYDESTLYLGYDAEHNYLQITKDTPSGDYITIDNTAYSTGNKGKLDETYFEADIVSRITSSNPLVDETKASAARLLSDWASRYIKAKDADYMNSVATAAKKVQSSTDPKKYTFEFSEKNLDDEEDRDTSLVYGYYVFVTTDTNSGSDLDNEGSVINQSILNVPLTGDLDKIYTVRLKATPITVDKSVDNLIDANNKNNGAGTLKKSDSTKLDDDTVGGEKYDKITANIGDILQYKVESHIPALTSYVLSDNTKLVSIDTQLTENDFAATASTIKNKFVYTFRDTMINQDFIPAKVTDTTKYGDVVEGLIMEILNADTTVKATYYVKNFGTGDTPEYYLVKDSEDTESDAIGRLWETDYTVSSKQNFFAINFDLDKLKKLGLDGKDVVFTYNAELKGEAGNDDATNTAKFTYSNDPYDSKSTDTIEHKNEVYTYDLKVDKIFSDGAKTTDLYGKVKFKLYSDSNMTHVIKFVKKDDGSYVRVDSDDVSTPESPIDDEGIIAVNTTDGTLRLHGLGEGIYYLEEQSDDDLTNAGYNKLNPITINISAKKGNNITDSGTFDLFDNDDTAVTATLDGVEFTPGKISDNEYGIEFNVVNQKGFKLPFTGEFGNWALAISGILLVAVGGTVIVLVNRKKKDSPTDNEK